MKFKPFLTLLLVGLIYQKMSAQPTSPPKPQPVFIYLTMGTGYPSGFGLNLDLLFGKRFSASFFVNGHERNSPNTPSNFSFKTAPGSEHYSEVSEQILSWGLTAGKIFPTKNPNFRWHLKTGFGYSNFSRPENFQPKNRLLIFYGNNYTYDHVTYSSVSVVVEPVLEFPFSRNFGAGVGLILNVNKYWTFVGIHGNLHIGYLRPRINK